MLTWIRDLFSRTGDSGLEARSESRQKQAREAVAGKHEKEGTRDLLLGEKTKDSGLIQTGHDRIAVARRLRTSEMSLLEALNLGTESETTYSETTGGEDVKEDA